MEVNAVLVSFLIILFKHSLCQENSDCESKETCSECIQSVGCIWCVSPNKQHLPHCRNDAINNEELLRWCPKLEQISPKQKFSISDKRELTNQDENGNAVQIYPQRIQLSLRKGEEFIFKFKYRQAENYPIDLYYLMDLSASMYDHKSKLAQLGTKLAETMRNITGNFRLGFGSFVDKVELPFTSTEPKQLKSPCIQHDNKPCAPPYSFINHMSLSQDYHKFAQEVQQAKVSGNIDSPEGGFDAIMQAIVCKNEIGWREQARHLLVYSSNSDFHIAGDGKLAGVVEPNDAQCHMTDNRYTEYLEYDYPSVSQINYIAKQNNINLIFAIISDSNTRLLDTYKALIDHIENSNVGSLQKDSTNVINLVLDNYNKIVDSVTLTSDAPNDVDVKFSSSCPNLKDNGRKCSDIHVGEVVYFNATIKPLECLKNQSNTKTITIKPEGLQDSIIIDLEVICECNCTNSSSPKFEHKSTKCSYSGNLECGVCTCYEGYFGKNCQCDKTSSQTEDITNCKKSATDTEICSGAGNCKCGKCECYKRNNVAEKIYGPLCECDNYSCKREKGELCSKNGLCDCGKCQCFRGWTGDACQCPDDIACIAAGDDQVCSGKGTCQCGKCICNTEKHRYFGDYCQECTTCDRCEDLEKCVDCLTDKSKNCVTNCTSFIFEIVEKIEDEKLCVLLDENKCYLRFKHYYNHNNKLVVRAEKEKRCPDPVNLLAWILGVVVCVIVIGIITLIAWKIVTTIHDRREYAKFERERENMKWHRNENPLYKNASSTFRNPVYNIRSRFSFRNHN